MRIGWPLIQDTAIRLECSPAILLQYQLEGLAGRCPVSLLPERDPLCNNTLSMFEAPREGLVSLHWSFGLGISVNGFQLGIANVIGKHSPMARLKIEAQYNISHE